jgi:hypothetical protein
MRLLIFALLVLLCMEADAQAFPHVKAKGNPAWEATPQVVLDIKWHRTSGLSWVEDGVCHLAMQDDPVGLLVGDDQLARCLAQGAAKDKEAPRISGAQRVHFWSATPTQVVPMMEELHQEHQPQAYQIGGFYAMRKDYCLIVVNEKVRSFGHEFKHCEDGMFHGNTPSAYGMRWFPRKDK